MTFRFGWAGTLLATAVLAGQLSASPVVPGFDRFHSGANADAAGGRLLLGELNCVSCHTAEVGKKQAPNLDGIGTRARVGHLRKFLADPQASKPGTTMPNLFAGDPDAAAKVDALVHFLASTGSPKQARPDLKAVIRGKDTYTKVGCAACHGTRDMAGDPTKATFVGQVPLGDVKGKYTIPGLTTFLSDPLKVRPSGRMPHLLKPAEATDVAHYLLQGIKTNLPTGKGTTKYSFYEGSWNSLPDFGKLKPKASGTGVAFELGLAKADGNYGMRFEGVFRAESTGDYTFTLSSDDGSRLLIDGKKIVDNDGIHPPQTRSGTVGLTKGIHNIVVEFFQGGGEAVLDVEVESRGLGRQPLAPLVAATEAELDKKADTSPVKDDDALVIDKDLANKGKGLFVSAGCANCHQITGDKKIVESTLRAKPLASLPASGGCISGGKGLPKYDLSADQQKAITAALGEKKPTEVSIAHTMKTFNCYACHARDKVGGPMDSTNALFTTTTPEMGDEGRVPPPLDGVGAKLQADYLKNLLDKGADDRPYMHTRMPGFGATNVGHLVDVFAKSDSMPVVPAVKFDQPEAKVISAGRHMVGAQAFGCIKCHTFAGNKAEGVQGIDMLLMTKRLKRDWFHAYCIDPQKVRPGTRMPTAWPGGQSLLAQVLDGEARTQIDAIWMYLGSKSPAIPVGMGKKFIPLNPTDGAIIYRNFIQGAGARAIGVGYPEKLNLAFDANDLRLAMIWKGGFIDAARHWTDRGVGFEGPLGDDVLSLPGGPTAAVLSKPDANWPSNARAEGQRFLGYTTTADDRPTFRYLVGGATIEDFINPGEKDKSQFVRTITVTSEKPVENLFVRVASGNKIAAVADGWTQVDGYKVKVTGTATSTRTVGGKTELLVPVKDAKTKIVIEIAW